MLTEKQALEKSLDLWIWLYQNPGKGKEDYPGYRELEFIYQRCWLCEYSLRQDNSFCTSWCPGSNENHDCFDGAYEYWFMDIRNKYNYGAKISAAYIAAKIRRRLRKVQGEACQKVNL